ncbi:hypothetical protein D3C73_575000 [compost metagenome]
MVRPIVPLLINKQYTHILTHIGSILPVSATRLPIYAGSRVLLIKLSFPDNFNKIFRFLVIILKLALIHEHDCRNAMQFCDQ